MISTSVVSVLAFVFGAIVGSFLSVCIYRIPHGRVPEELNPAPSSEAPDSSIVTAEPARTLTVLNPSRSFCPKCEHQLYWYHNIPLLSWIFLRGKCAFCSAKISARYPLVELLSALFSLLSFQTFGPNLTGFVVYVFCAALIVISFIDYDYYIIPNVISLPGTLIAAVIAGVNQYTSIFKAPIVPDLMSAFWGLLAGAGFLFFVSEVYLRLRKKEGLGMGDVKLLAMTGVLFGVPGALYTIFLGSFAGSVIGISLILLSGRKMSHQLPFGPYLAIGTLLYLFVGSEQLSLWFGILTGMR